MKAIVFPGQGTQYMGMGKDLYETFGPSKRIFDLIDETLGWKLSQVCFQGPKEKLKDASVQELAVLAVSLAAYEVFKGKDIEIDFLSGLSLGECTCLYPAGVLGLEETVFFVKERARLMEEAARNNPSCMFAIIGLGKEQIEQKSKGDGFYIANVNSPHQTVISCRREDKEKVKGLFKGLKAKTVELEVSGGFHSPFITSAREQFGKFVENLEFKRPKIPIVNNVTARAHTDEEEIKTNLIEQFTSPVLWQGCVEFMIQNGVRLFYEIGPSRILRKLIKKTAPEADTINIENKEDLDTLSKDVQLCNT